MAELVCKKLGFHKAEFIGLKDDYYKFAKSRGIQINKANVEATKDCLPEYKIAGGICTKKASDLNDVSSS